MDALVINLREALERWASMARQLDALCVPYARIEAVRGATLGPEVLAQLYNDKAAKFYRCRSLNPAEIGCALSHLRAYDTVVQRGLPMALILEDDVALEPQLPAVLADLQAMLDVSVPAVVLLSPAWPNERATPTAVGGQGHRMQLFAAGFYASSYVVTHRAAELLLQTLRPVHDVADCWERLARHELVPVHVVVPALSQQQHEFGSSTTDDFHRQRQGAAFWLLKYRMRRIRYLIWDRLLRPSGLWKGPRLI